MQFPEGMMQQIKKSISSSGLRKNEERGGGRQKKSFLKKTGNQNLETCSDIGYNKFAENEQNYVLKSKCLYGSDDFGADHSNIYNLYDFERSAQNG